MPSLSRSIARRPGRVLGIALAASILLALAASRLELETQLTALLPEGAPEARDYGLFLDLFGGFEKVFVLVLADPVAGSAQDAARDFGDLLDAAEGLAEELASSPEVAAVRTGLEPQDEEFFLRYVVRRAPLLVPEASLSSFEERLRPEALERRVAELRAQLSSPAGALTGRLAVFDPLGLAVDLPLLAAGGGDLPIDPWTGAFASPEGD
ncbi:MAG: hypothetical protein AAF725_12755, partial [Acidobacteriota bacterium]